MSIGNFPEILSQRILVGIILVGRLGVPLSLLLAAVRRMPITSFGNSGAVYGRPILYTTTTTQRGLCIEAFVSILVQSQSQKSLPGGGGV